MEASSGPSTRSKTKPYTASTAARMTQTPTPASQTAGRRDSGPHTLAGAPRRRRRRAGRPRHGFGRGRLGRDGRLDQLHALTQTYYASVTTTADGNTFVGAGDKGRIYLIDSEDSVSTAFDVSERMVSQLIHDPKKGLSFTTGDAAAFYRTTGRAKKSTYLSKPFDPRRQRASASWCGIAREPSSSRPEAATPRSRARAGASGPRPGSLREAAAGACRGGW